MEPYDSLCKPTRDLLILLLDIPHEAAEVLSNSCIDRFAACACNALTQDLLVPGRFLDSRTLPKEILKLRGPRCKDCCTVEGVSVSPC